MCRFVVAEDLRLAARKGRDGETDRHPQAGCQALERGGRP
jgi:hypothetical protein